MDFCFFFLCFRSARGKQIDHLQQQLKVCEEAREEKQHLARVAQANLEELGGPKEVGKASKVSFADKYS